MELSIFVAKIFAIYFLVTGIGVLSGKMNVYKMLKSFEDSPALTFVTGLFLLIIGALLVQHHNIWSGSWWVVLITLLGWGTLLKGCIMMAYPQFLFQFKGFYKNLHPALGAVGIVIGLVLGYFLFMA